MRRTSEVRRHIVLIACAAQKRDHAIAARNLYTSNLFQKNLTFANALSPDAIYILSAKHGLLSLDERVEPYNETLNSKSASERRAWAKRILEQLERVTDFQKDRFTFLAGEKYRESLLPLLPNSSVPMKGLKIGQQLKFLNTHLRKPVEQ